MCDLFDQSSAEKAMLQKQQDAADAALKAQQDALALQQAASAGESESTRLAQDQRMRKILASGPFGAAGAANYGTPTVGTRQLYGDA